MDAAEAGDDLVDGAVRGGTGVVGQARSVWKWVRSRKGEEWEDLIWYVFVEWLCVGERIAGSGGMVFECQDASMKVGGDKMELWRDAEG